MKIKSNKLELRRRQILKNEILKYFGQLSIYQVEKKETEFEKSDTRMIEIIQIHSQGITVMDILDDTELSPVIFPKNILSEIALHDVFMVTIGLRDARWEVIFMSPPYDVGIF